MPAGAHQGASLGDVQPVQGQARKHHPRQDAGGHRLPVLQLVELELAPSQKDRNSLLDDSSNLAPNLNSSYFEREVLPHVPDAWIDHGKTKVGYDIPLNRHFYRYEPPRELTMIEDEIKALETDIVRLLGEVTA